MSRRRRLLVSSDLRKVNSYKCLEIPEIDLPDHAEMDFDEENPMQLKIKIDLTKEESLWHGGIYDFVLDIDHKYPHKAPKATCKTPVSPVKS